MNETREPGGRDAADGASEEDSSSRPNEAADSRPKTAIVLAGGGSLGAIEVGMLKALTAHGVRADLVVGASVGAINGACFAGSPDMAGVRLLERLWRALRQEQVFRFSRLGSLLDLASRRNYLVSPEPLRNLLERCLPFKRLEDAAIPCHVVATDILAGTEVVLSSGPAVEALLASASIPPVFPPVRIGERFLVDGGLANHTPVSTAVALGAMRVIVLPTGFGCAVERPPHGAVTMALHALSLLIARQLVLDIERFHDAVELVVLPPLCPVTIFPYDFAHTGELIDRAEVATRDWIARGGLRKSRVPGSLHLHDHRVERFAPARENRGDGPPEGECASPVLPGVLLAASPPEAPRGCGLAFPSRVRYNFPPSSGPRSHRTEQASAGRVVARGSMPVFQDSRNRS